MIEFDHKIMIVDDQKENLRLLNEILAIGGYGVRPTTSPIFAVESAIANPPPLVLLDIIMPEMSGIEVCRKLRSNPRTRDVPVLFLTGLAGSDIDEEVSEVGGNGYIQKPFHVKDILTRVAALMPGQEDRRHRGETE